MNNNRLTVLVSLSGVILLLIAADIRYNKEEYTLTKSTIEAEGISNAQENTNINSGSAEQTILLNTDLLQKGGIVNSELKDAKNGKEIFDIRLETLEKDIRKRYIYQNEFPLGFVYELEPGIPYETIKEQLIQKAQTSPVIRIQETNAFGTRSFYMNNDNKKETTFVLIEFQDQLLGFEYPKQNHDLFITLFDALKNNL